MKNQIKITIAALVLTSFAFEGCKKGENDPAISLHSRKARVAGDWEVVSYKMSSVNNYPSNPSQNSSATYTLNGSTYTYVSTDASGTDYSYGTDLREYTFEKNGTYDFTQTQDGIRTASKGTWNFTSGVGDLKNKSQISLYEQQSTNSSGSYTWTVNYVDAAFDLKELRKDKMVWYYKSSSSSFNGNTSYEVEIEFEPK